MVRKYSGGTFVPGGTYLNMKRWEFVGVPPEGDYLENGGATYYRFPVLLVLLAGPLAGLAFILFLPVAVPAVLIYAIGRRIGRGLRARWSARPHLRLPFAR